MKADWEYDGFQTFGVGAASTLDTSVKHPRKKKHPIGFVDTRRTRENQEGARDELPPVASTEPSVSAENSTD